MGEATELQVFMEQHNDELALLGLMFLRMLHAEMMVMGTKPSPFFCTAMALSQRGEASYGGGVDLPDLLTEFSEIDHPS
jgi:hypothetical protein